MKRSFAGKFGALCYEVIHVVAYAVTKIMADLSYTVQSHHVVVTAIGVERRNQFDSLLKHSNERIEVSLVLVADLLTEPGCLLAVGNHQFGDSSRCRPGDSH